MREVVVPLAKGFAFLFFVCAFTGTILAGAFLVQYGHYGFAALAFLPSAVFLCAFAFVIGETL